MPGRDALTADDLRDALLVYRGLLRAHEAELNRLNVYPVADADTGTNMALTMESVAVALAGARSAREVCRAVAHGALMGGRGNSGIILAQVLGAVSSAFEVGERVDARGLATALDDARTHAYAAVADPVEGTILTVLSAAAGAARVRQDDSLEKAVRAVAEEARDAVGRTRTQLPELQRAGVVDAAGLGLALLFDAVVHVVTGEAIEGAEISMPERAQRRGLETSPRYEVVLLLTADDDAARGLRTRWAELGESIAVAGGGGLFKCHVHTNDVDAAIAAARAAGAVDAVEVEDLAAQVEALDERSPRVVVTAPCEGAEELVAELGATLDADARMDDDTIVVGPRAGPGPSIDVASLAPAVAALVAFDLQLGVAENVALMNAAAGRVRAGAAEDPHEAVAVIDSLMWPEAELVTIFAGDGDAAGAETIVRQVRRAYPHAAVEVHALPRREPSYEIGVE